MGEFISQAWTLFTTHDWVGIFGLAAAVLLTLLTDRAKFMPSWDSPWRPFLGSICAAMTMVLNQVQHGGSAAAIFAGLVQTSLPTLAAEFAALMHSNKTGGGSVVVDLSSAMRSVPPPPPTSSAALVGLAIALCGCPSAGAKRDAATVAVIHVTKEECQAKALQIVASANTCLQAQGGLARLAQDEPACVAILGAENFGSFCVAGAK